MGHMTEGSPEQKERDWLAREVILAAGLTDRDRIRILCDLLETADAIRKCKTPEELQRDEAVRIALDREPGLNRYRALAERVG